MKIRSIIILAFAAITITSCQKEEDMVSPVSYTDNNIDGTSDQIAKAAIPTTFTQKMLMEMYSTVSCATCPDAELKHENYALSNPDKVYGVNVHTNDAMSNAQFSYLDGLLNVTAFSSGSFNRLPFNGVTAIHKTGWNKTIVGTTLGKTAACGLKIVTTTSGTNATAIVTAGFNKTLSGSYKLSIYLIEDNVVGTGSGFNQSNYYNNITTSPFYQLGNPIIGYQHSYVLRKVITPAQGFAIPATSINAGGSFAKTYTFSTIGYNPTQLYIVAFVNKLGSTFTTQEIMNVQRVALGSTKNWD